MNELIEEITNKLCALKCQDSELSGMLQKVSDKLDLSEKIEQCLSDSELYLVYKHTAPNGKIYIGITQNHPQTRWSEGAGYEKQPKFSAAIRRFGWINFKHEILAAALTKQQALDIENNLIISTESYKSEYGYNTRVILDEKCNTTVKPIKSKAEKPSSKPSKSARNSDILLEIAREMIDKYSIQTISGKILYKQDGILVSERVHPFIEKVLLTEYKLPENKRKELIREIKIISHTQECDLKDDEHSALRPETEGHLSTWLDRNNLSEANLTIAPTTVLYEKYKDWCKTSRLKPVLGKKQFYKKITDRYHFIRKQRVDGKRYFALNK